MSGGRVWRLSVIAALGLSAAAAGCARDRGGPSPAADAAEAVEAAPAPEEDFEQRVARIIEGLSERFDRDARLRAIDEAAGLGSRGDAVVPALRQAVADAEDHGVIAMAARALGQIRTPAAIEALASVLDAEDSSSWALARRKGALIALQDVGPRARAVRASLERLAQRGGLDGGRARGILKMLDLAEGHEARALEAEAEAALAGRPPPWDPALPPAVKSVLHRLGSKDEMSGAIYDAGELGPAAAPAVPALAKVLRKPPADEPELRESAAEALAKIGTPEAFDALLDELERPALLKWNGHIGGALAAAGESARPAAPRLREMVKKRKGDWKMAAAVLRENKALADEGAVAARPAMREEVQTIIAELETLDVERGLAAAVEMLKLGPEAAGAVPAYVRFLARREDDERVQQAGITLGGIVPGMGAAAVPRLVTLLDDPAERVREMAAENLGTIAAWHAEDADARAALAGARPAVAKALGREWSAGVRVALEQSLAAIGRVTG